MAYQYAVYTSVQGMFPKGFINTVSGAEMFKHIQLTRDGVGKLYKTAAK